MRLIFERMKAIFPRLNQLPVTLNRIKTAARENHVELFFTEMKYDGAFFPASVSASGKPEIFINNTLSEKRQIGTGVHEFSHMGGHSRLNRVLYSCHRTWNFDEKQEIFLRRKHEFEAHAMGALALFPAPRLHKGAFDLWDEFDDYLLEVWRLRIYLRKTYGI